MTSEQLQFNLNYLALCFLIVCVALAYWNNIIDLRLKKIEQTLKISQTK